MNETFERIANLPPKKLALLAWELQSKLQAMERSRREPIAIIGIGCRFPGADGPEAFWRLLRDGVDAITEVPPERWDIQAYYDPDPDAPGKMSTRFGAFLEGVDQFDPQFFGIAPREAQSMDPQQRLLLEVCWEALENAGQSPERLRGSPTGVFVGISGNDYQWEILRREDAGALDVYLATGVSHSVASGRISYLLGLHGPSFAVDTACSSSLVAVHEACLSLRAGECRMALAGGVNVILSPEVTIALSRAHMMAPDGRCKTFDARGDGFVRGEGCGIVVLKRLADALADGDPVLGVIRGTAINQDGRSSGLTAPNGPAQEDVIRKALADGQVEPDQVAYVEAHGTGTSLGDPIEVRALGAVLGKNRPKDRPLLIGSVKTNFGHLESAAGVAGLIKVILALQQEVIPPHLHFNDPSPYIPWADLPVMVPTVRTPWPRGNGQRIGGVSSFGFSGTNVHMVVEEPPELQPVQSGVDRPLHLLSLSAKTDGALRELAERYERRLATDPSRLLADICFTANTGRAQFSHRLAVVAGSTAELHRKLAVVSPGEEMSGVIHGQTRATTPPEIAFLFTGQGAQYVGMGRELYETQPTFRRVMERCAEVLKPVLDQPLLSVLYPKAGETSPLDETAYTQPALFALEYALAELWRSWGIEPALVMGHSVGEYVAACVAGVFSLEDGLQLIAARGRLMQALPKGGEMAAVFADETRVRAAIAPHARSVSIAAINGPENMVISGEARAVRTALDVLAAAGIKSKRLTVSHAFHSPLLEPMLDTFERAVSRVTLSRSRLGIVSNLTGRVADPEELADAAYWGRHVRETVRFQAGMETLRKQGARIFVEVGPAPVLLGMGQACLPEGAGVWLPTLRKGRSDWEQVLASLGELYVRGGAVDWAGFDRDYPRSKVVLPTYPFERERYWIEAAPPGQTRGTVPAAAAKVQPPPDQWSYEVAWRPKPLADDHSAPASAAGRWLILADEEGLGAALRDELSSRGGACTLVRAAAGLEVEELEAVVGSEDGQSSWSGIVHLWSLNLRLGDAATSRSLVDAQRVSCGTVLHLVQALGRCRGGERPRLWVVTRGAQPVGQEPGPVAVAQSPVWGLAKVVALEHPELRCTRIDLDPADGDSGVRMLLAELTRGDGEDQVAFRGGSRRVARLVRSAPPPPQPSALPFRADAVYLVTGGLTGLGLVVARWMADNGARHLVLMGRRAPSSASQETIRQMEQAGVGVVVSRGDVSNEAELRSVLEEIDRCPWALRGVVHSAGVIEDGVLLNQDWPRFERVMAPKVAGAWNLHRLVSGRTLDFFVLFSSAAALLGSPGQGNYAAANTFLDALAHHRRALSLASLSINWGPWGEVGMAVERHLERRLALQGMRVLAPQDGLEALARLLGRPAPQVGVVLLDWDRVSSQLLTAPYFSELQTAGASAEGSGEGAVPDLRQQLTRHPPGRRANLLLEVVQMEAIKVLGLDPSKHLDPERPLHELGLDSLMAMELRNGLGRAAGQTLPVSLVFDHPSIERLVQYLGREVLGLELTAGKRLPIPSGERASEEALEDLSEDEMARLLAQRLDTIDQRVTR